MSWADLLHTPRAMLTTLRRSVTPLPERKLDLPFRGLPAVLVDSEGGSPCTLCEVCIHACPTQSIHCGGQTGGPWPDIDEQRCMCCGICVVVCPAQAIAQSADSSRSIDGQARSRRIDR
jgi:formate hydrogenlyase subunit 6/NADH:ubiquinone oxidoreductase subunit I